MPLSMRLRRAERGSATLSLVPKNIRFQIFSDLGAAERLMANERNPQVSVNRAITVAEQSITSKGGWMTRFVKKAGANAFAYFPMLAHGKSRYARWHASPAILRRRFIERFSHTAVTTGQPSQIS